ncbi:MAG: PAS domain-containing sensor histidine kinase [Chloroflexota bacterium]|nr:PAS domain-containing sensor histidine kinase [Chloroflexota bacterium]
MGMPVTVASALGCEALTRVFDRSSDAIQIVDPRGLTVYANRAFRQLFGVPEGATPVGRAHDAPDGNFRRALERALDGEEVEVADLALAPSAAPPSRARAVFTPLRDPDGSPRGAIVQYQDVRVPDAGQLLAEVAEAKARLDAAIDSANEGILVHDREGRIALANPFAHELYGLPRGRLVGLGPGDLAVALRGCFADGAEFDAAFPPARGRGDPEAEYTREYRLARPRARVVRQTTRPICDQLGRLLGRVTILHDVTAERAAVRARDRLLSVASHELKTPLTSIKGFAQLLQRDLARPEGRVTDRGRHHLAALLHQLDRLTGLVNELLDVTRLEADELELRRERCDLVALAAEAVEHANLRLAATRAGHARPRVALDTSQASLVGHWDPGRLDQALTNLLDNAIKFSPAGGRVRVAVREGAGWAQLTVADEGIGIPVAELANLFKPFARAGNVTGQGYSGFGLGLYIARRIVERHGGRIWAESVEGRGSAFHLRLPLGESQV